VRRDDEQAGIGRDGEQEEREEGAHGVLGGGGRVLCLGAREACQWSGERPRQRRRHWGRHGK
jgi:hypothetical protein